MRTRLAEQNALKGWRECKRHRFGEVQIVGGGPGEPVFEYHVCMRCPVTVRKHERKVVRVR